MIEKSLDAVGKSLDAAAAQSASCFPWATVGVCVAVIVGVGGYLIYKKITRPKLVTYRDVVAYFTENKSIPKFAGFKKTAAIREPGKKDGEYRLSLCFLDEKNDIMGGLIYDHALLDEDLKDMFGKKDMIIFEGE
ncbi:MAG: hypothetical protein Q4E17_05180 [Synergistes sp.]|nr:hypothetical protein [Synergistes sp.]